MSLFGVAYHFLGVVCQFLGLYITFWDRMSLFGVVYHLYHFWGRISLLGVGYGHMVGVSHLPICPSGDCDPGVERIIDLMGWRQDFELLMKERETITDIRANVAPENDVELFKTKSPHLRYLRPNMMSL